MKPVDLVNPDNCGPKGVDNWQMVDPAAPAIRAFRDAFCRINYQRLRDLLDILFEHAPFWEFQVDINDLLGLVTAQMRSVDRTTSFANHQPASVNRLLFLSMTLQGSCKLLVEGINGSKQSHVIPEGAVYVGILTGFDDPPQESDSTVLQLSLAFPTLAFPKGCMGNCNNEQLASLRQAAIAWLGQGTLWIPTMYECQSHMWSAPKFAEMRFSANVKSMSPMKGKVNTSYYLATVQESNDGPGTLLEPNEHTVEAVAQRIKSEREEAKIALPAGQERDLIVVSVDKEAKCEESAPLGYVKTGPSHITTEHQERNGGSALNIILPGISIPSDFIFAPENKEEKLSETDSKPDYGDPVAQTLKHCNADTQYQY